MADHNSSAHHPDPQRVATSTYRNGAGPRDQRLSPTAHRRRYDLNVVIVVMGATGAGKTTIGRALAAELGWRYIEGDAYHPAANIEKMSAGIPLTDADRVPWLAALADAIARAVNRRESLVVACSALKERYRAVLRDHLRPVRFVYLKATEALLRDRLATRQGHFAGSALASSQLAALEEPTDALTITVDASLEPEEILWRIRQEFGI